MPASNTQAANLIAGTGWLVAWVEIAPLALDEPFVFLDSPGRLNPPSAKPSVLSMSEQIVVPCLLHYVIFGGLKLLSVL